MHGELNIDWTWGDEMDKDRSKIRASRRDDFTFWPLRRLISSPDICSRRGDGQLDDPRSNTQTERQNSKLGLLLICSMLLVSSLFSSLFISFRSPLSCCSSNLRTTHLENREDLLSRSAIYPDSLHSYCPKHCYRLFLPKELFIE